eukprot:scaffold198085_cov18-Tisochrysis_lutea.AAC.1
MATVELFHAGPSNTRPPAALLEAPAADLDADCSMAVAEAARRVAQWRMADCRACAFQPDAPCAGEES